MATLASEVRRGTLSYATLPPAPTGPLADPCNTAPHVERPRLGRCRRGRSVRGENTWNRLFSIAPPAEVADRPGPGNEILDARVPIGAAQRRAGASVFDAVVIDRLASAAVLDAELAPLGKGCIGESGGA